MVVKVNVSCGCFFFCFCLRFAQSIVVDDPWLLLSLVVSQMCDVMFMVVVVTEIVIKEFVIVYFLYLVCVSH